MRGIFYLTIIALLVLTGCADGSDVKNEILSETVDSEDSPEIEQDESEEVIEMKLSVNSPEFLHNERIPAKYTCDGDNVNPPLKILDIPEEAVSLVLIVDDPDAPGGNWDHWVVWNIPPTEEIDEDSIPGTEGVNDFRKNAWGGPCPPSGTHRYFFKVYALDSQLELDSDARKNDVYEAMEGHVMAEGELIGVYSRD